MQNRFVAVDVETTGLLPVRGHCIIEIGAVRVDNLGDMVELRTGRPYGWPNSTYKGAVGNSDQAE